MEELKDTFGQVAVGHGRLVVLAGEPGIGKTRIAQELAKYAASQGAEVLWGSCYEERGAPSYWPWTEAVRPYIRAQDVDLLLSQMGQGAPVIAEIVDDVRDRLPELETPRPLGHDEARFRLLDSFSNFLTLASATCPMLIVLDDLHWADQASLLLLRFLGRRLKSSHLMIIGTYRDELNSEHPLVDTLGELTRVQSFLRLELGGLSGGELGRFIKAAGGVEPPASLVDAVMARTEGNPLFVAEVVRLLPREGRLVEEAPDVSSWDVRVPERVREVIGLRVNRLSEGCQRSLTIASVIGPDFALRLLVQLLDDASEDRLLEHIDEGLRTRLIEELPSRGRYQFTHALVQETLAQRLSLARRAQLHGRIAEILEDLYGTDAEAHAAELVYHLAEARTVLGEEKLLSFCLAAGNNALAAYASDDAKTFFQRGLDATEGRQMDPDAAALLGGLGRAYCSLGG